MILEPKLPAKRICGDSCGRGMLALRFGAAPSRGCFLSSLNLLLRSRAEIAGCTESCSRFPAAAWPSLSIKVAVMGFLVFVGVGTMELAKASLRSSRWHASMGR